MSGEIVMLFASRKQLSALKTSLHSRIESALAKINADSAAAYERLQDVARDYAALKPPSRETSEGMQKLTELTKEYLDGQRRLANGLTTRFNDEMASIARLEARSKRFIT